MKQDGGIMLRFKLPELSEHQIQTQIINFLQYRGYMVFRMNAGSIRTQGGKLVKLAPAGTPDIMAFKPAYEGGVDLYFIEVKRPKGKLTFFQEHKIKELEQYGAQCFVAYSIEEVQERFK